MIPVSSSRTTWALNSGVNVRRFDIVIPLSWTDSTERNEAVLKVLGLADSEGLAETLSDLEKRERYAATRLCPDIVSVGSVVNGRPVLGG